MSDPDADNASHHVAHSHTQATALTIAAPAALTQMQGDNDAARPLATSLIACRECDLLVRDVPLQRHESLRCPRCDFTLGRAVQWRLDAMLPLALAATFVFVMANAFPFMRIEVAGTPTIVTPLVAAETLIAQDLPAVGVLVVLTTLVIPGLQALAQAVLGATLIWPHVSVLARGAVRLENFLRPWSMLEVLLLAVLVSLVRIGALVPIEPGIGLYSFAALIVLNLVASRCFDPFAYWSRIDLLPLASAVTVPLPRSER